TTPCRTLGLRHRSLIEGRRVNVLQIWPNSASSSVVCAGARHLTPGCLAHRASCHASCSTAAHMEIDTMTEPPTTNRTLTPPRSSRRSRLGPTPIQLWRLRGATDELRGLAFETSFTYP